MCGALLDIHMTLVCPNLVPVTVFRTGRPLRRALTCRRLVCLPVKVNTVVVTLRMALLDVM